MTRERAKELAPIIQAFGEGKAIQVRRRHDVVWLDAQKPLWLDDYDFRIKPVPSLRPMTRGEVLYEITSPTHMVMRAEEGSKISPAIELGSWDNPQRAEYAIIDKNGDPIDGWHKFEITE